MSRFNNPYEWIQQIKSESEDGKLHAVANDAGMVEYFGVYLCEVCAEPVKGVDGTPWLSIEGMSTWELLSLADDIGHVEEGGCCDALDGIAVCMGCYQSE
jgi:hypothetical protein